MIKIHGANQIKIAKSKKKLTIFLDLDGVLADWLKSACSVCGIDENESEVKRKLKQGIHLEKIGKISEEELWKKIDAKETNFWENLEKLPWADDLVKACNDLGDMYFLTSSGDCVYACTGKAIWIKKYYPEYLNRLIIFREKEVLANKNTILVDDSESKITKFQKAGGYVFHWPNQYKIEEDNNIYEIFENLKKKVNCI